MKRFFLLLAFLAVPLSSFGKVVDYIAAVVNGEPILYSDVVKAAKENRTSNLREALDRLIEREILITEAKKEGIKVSDKEVQRALKELMERNGFKDEKEFEKALKEEGLTLEEVKRKLRKQLLIAKLIAKDVKSKVEVSESEIDRVCRKIEGKKVRDVYYIFTKSRSKAERAISLLQEGVPFEKVAKELSEDRITAKEGGHIGKVGKGMLIKPLDQAVWSIKPGSYELVRTDKGFFIVYVKAQEEGRCNREKIRQELYMKKFQETLNNFLNRLKREASVKVYM